MNNDFIVTNSHPAFSTEQMKTYIKNINKLSISELDSELITINFFFENCSASEKTKYKQKLEILWAKKFELEMLSNGG